MNLRRWPLIGIIIALFSLTACASSLQSFASRVGNVTITSSDVVAYIKAFAVVAQVPASQSEIAPDGSIASASAAAARLSQLTNVEAFRQVLAKHGVHVTDQQRLSLTNLILASSGASATQRLGTLSARQRKLLLETNILPGLFSAIVNGATASDTAPIVCARELAFSATADATAALGQSKTSGSFKNANGGVDPAETCVVDVKGGVSPLQVAIAGQAVNSFVGPFKISGGSNGDEFHIAQVTSRKTLTFADWPVEALDSFPPKPGANVGAFVKEVRALKVQVNPRFGTLVTNPAQASQICGPSTIECINAPQDRSVQTLPPSSPNSLLQP